LWSMRGDTLRWLISCSGRAFTVPGPLSPKEVKRVKAYEVLLMLDPSLDEEAQSAVVEKVGGIIKAGGGTVDDVDTWGKRKLAYEINDLQDAIYVVVRFHAAPAEVAELDRVLHITNQVVRAMIVRLEHVA